MSEKTRVPLTIFVLVISLWTLLGTLLRPRFGPGTLVLTSGLGFLIRWIYTADYPNGRSQTPEGTSRAASLKSGSKNSSPVSKKLAETDDLKVIEGIGPVIADALERAGIHSFSDLASLDSESLDRILQDEGIRRFSDIHTWPEQARLAADGDWEGLSRLQDNLRAGRRE